MYDILFDKVLLIVEFTMKKEPIYFNVRGNPFIFRYNHQSFALNQHNSREIGIFERRKDNRSSSHRIRTDVIIRRTLLRRKLRSSLIMKISNVRSKKMNNFEETLIASNKNRNKIRDKTPTPFLRK